MTDVRSTAALGVAKAAAVELPVGGWGSLVPSLLSGAGPETPRGPRSAALQALGYVCEELANVEDDVLDEQTVNEVLTRVVSAASAAGAVSRPEPGESPEQAEAASGEVRLAALVALNNALEFASENMKRENERNYIMQVVCEGTMAADPRVRQAAWECLVSVAAQNYEELPAYMRDIFELSKRAIEDVEEPVALQALEFWCTVCEEEDEADERPPAAGAAAGAAPVRGHGFVPAALPHLVPLLLGQLTRQDDLGGGGEDDGAWNRAVAAATCLGLAAAVAGDAALPLVMPYVQENIGRHDGEESWRCREAATFAFGSVLDGPAPQALAAIVSQALPFLLTALRDPDARVKNTTAWALGRAFEHVHGLPDVHVLDAASLPAVVAALVESTRDLPHVAEKACYALGQLASGYAEADPDAVSTPFSEHFPAVVQALLEAAFRGSTPQGAQQLSHAEASRLQSQAIEAANMVVRAAPDDTLPVVAQLLPALVQRLADALAQAQAQTAGAEVAERQAELQGLLCVAIQVAVQRLSDQEAGKQVVRQLADELVKNLLAALAARGSTVREEAMLALGALVYACGASFERYAPHVFPAVEAGLAAHSEWQLCQASIGTLGDLCRELDAKVAPYCDSIMLRLLQGLQGGDVPSSLKPQIVSAFGDVAIAIGDTFEKYLPAVLQMLNSASQLAVSQTGSADPDADAALRTSIVEAWAGLLNGLSKAVSARSLAPSTPGLLDVVVRLCAETKPDESPRTAKAAVAILGDVAAAIPGAGTLFAQRPALRDYVEATANVPEIADTAAWALDHIDRATA